MFDLEEVKIDELTNSHKHTQKLLALVNKFLAQTLKKYEAFLDVKDNKQRIDNVFIELVEYCNKEDREIWLYNIKFPTDRDHSLEIENAMGKISNIFSEIQGVFSKINFQNTLVELSVIEFKSSGVD